LPPPNPPGAWAQPADGQQDGDPPLLPYRGRVRRRHEGLHRRSCPSPLPPFLPPSPSITIGACRPGLFFFVELYTIPVGASPLRHLDLGLQMGSIPPDPEPSDDPTSRCNHSVVFPRVRTATHTGAPVAPAPLTPAAPVIQRLPSPPPPPAGLNGAAKEKEFKTRAFLTAVVTPSGGEGGFSPGDSRVHPATCFFLTPGHSSLIDLPRMNKL